MNTKSFVEKIEIAALTDGCWLWTGAVGSDGYGVVRGAGGTVAAHRRAYRVFKGPIPEDLCVLHRCDNTLCVSPTHLFLGTKKDNSVDMLRKGRQGMPLHKLSWPEVRAIRAALGAGETKRSLAERYGVCRSTIQDIEKGVSWKEGRASDGRQMELFESASSYR